MHGSIARQRSSTRRSYHVVMLAAVRWNERQRVRVTQRESGDRMNCFNGGKSCRERARGATARARLSSTPTLVETAKRSSTGRETEVAAAEERRGGQQRRHAAVPSSVFGSRYAHNADARTRVTRTQRVAWPATCTSSEIWMTIGLILNAFSELSPFSSSYLTTTRHANSHRQDVVLQQASPLATCKWASAAAAATTAT